LLALLPGDALYRLCFADPDAPGKRPPLTLGEGLFLRLFGGMLLVGWWALLLAEVGQFGRAGVVLGVTALSIGLYALAWRLHGDLGLRIARSRPTITGLAFTLILLVFSLLTFGRPFETIVGGEDAGIYFNTGGQIARSGGIQYVDNGLAEFGDAAAEAEDQGPVRHLLLPLDRSRYQFVSWQRFQGFFLLEDAAPNTVTPQFLHLFPTWLALWATFGGGVGAMVYGSIAFGLLGVVATALLARRLFGPLAGLAAGALLAFNGLQLWFARQTLTEVFLQALLVGGIYAWTVFIEARDREATAAARGAALVAALALGSVALAHAQFVFALLPVAALVAWLWLARRWSGIYWWFFLPLIIILAHATFHIARYSLGYFEGIYHHVWRNAVRDWEQTTILFLGPALLLLALGLRPLRARWLPLVTDARARRAARWLGALGILALGGWLYLIRPGIIQPSNLGGLNGYIGAPVPPGPESALVSLGWYLSPVGMLLAGFGLALLVLRDFEERIAAVLCTALPFAVLYLTGTYTQGGYIYSLRRFVPLLAPLLVILIAYAAVRIGPLLAETLRRPHLSRPLRLRGVAPVALLLLFYIATNGRLALHREYDGVLAATGQLAARFGPDDIVIFSGPRDETPKLATPLQYLFGRESWVITTNSPNGTVLDAWISAQEARGRRVHILMSAGGGKLFLPAHRLTAVERIDVPLLQFEKLDFQKPFNEQRNLLGYTLYSLQPVVAGQSALGTPPYTVTAGAGDEFALLSPSGTTPGFYNVEYDEKAADRPYRWTDGEALLRIPWPGDGRPLTLRLTLSAGPRPPELPPAQLIVGIRPTPGDDKKEMQLGVLTIGNEWAEYTITIPPDAIERTADGTALIHLAVPRVFDGKNWQPAPGTIWKPVAFPDATNRSLDARELHIRFGAAELTVGP
jgi:hypothetical protein